MTFLEGLWGYAAALTGVGERDLVGLVGVQPHSLSTALHDRGGQAFLHFKSYHCLLYTSDAADE